MKRKALLGAAAAVLMFVGAAGPARAGDNPAKRPIMIETARLPWTSTELCAPTAVLIHSEGQEIATHLGLATTVQDLCLDMTGLALWSTMSLTAANGDELRSVWVGSQFGPGPAGGLSFVATYRFDGGTGRFASATGQITTTGVAYQTGLGVGYSTSSSEGWISY